MKSAALTAAALAAVTLPLAAADSGAPKTATQKPKSPNIIVILSDDMGFTDIGCYGSEIRTPALNALAAGGLRFTQFYNNARCCPSRASLLTGLYPHQAGMGHMTRNRKLPGYTGSLRENCTTIAEVLRPAGYSTYAVGKWHVSISEHETENFPLQRGFDKFYGTLAGAGSFFDPANLCRGNTPVSPYNDPEYRPGRYYYTDAIADNAVRFLQQHQGDTPEKPFFMYVAFTAAHWPMHALPEDIAKYKGVYDKGYNAIRAARLKRAVELGILPRGSELSPPDNTDWDKVPDKEWEIRCMEVYAAMIDRMDQGIARIVAHLKATGQLDNTVIMFMQDNGACAEPVGRASNKEQVADLKFDPMPPEKLQPNDRPPKPMQTRDGRPVFTGPETMPGPDDTYIAYGRDWANVSNTPFREYKHWVHEGGISTPLIVHWPAGIQAGRNGTFVGTPGHFIDIAATCVDLASATYPATRAGVALPPLSGVSLRPAFSGQSINRAVPIFWEHEGNRAVREGKWKLVAKGPKGAWELYDIETDRAELRSLAAVNPALVARLSSAWEAWAVETKAKPWPWDKGLPAPIGERKAKSAAKSAIE